MASKSKQSSWYRHFIYRRESWKTTWKFRLLLLALAAVVLIGGRGFWAKQVAQSLICSAQTPPSDALLVENFDPDYRVFEQAEELKRMGVAPRVFIPAETDEETESTSVELGTIELFARIAHLQG
jgi:hypothetical protein